MKYGETFEQRSTPEWGTYNLDYNEIKHLIKVRTTKGQAEAISIPGHQNGHKKLETFENELYAELVDQHQRIDLFVQSKSGEINRRLSHLHKQVIRLGRQGLGSTQIRVSVRRVEKYSKTEGEVLRAGEEIQSLARFVGAQRLAFQKLLKKYKKWTGSASLGSRFQQEVLGRVHSFSQKDFTPLLSQWTEVLAAVRAPFEAGLSWKSKPKEEIEHEPDPSTLPLGEGVGIADDTRKVLKVSGAQKVASDLHSIYKDGSDVDVDSALATLPLGSSAGKAVYWIHSDNVVQIHVLLLQYLRLRRTKDIDASSKSSHRSSDHESTDGYITATGNEAGAIICDDLQSFAKRRNSKTITDIESMPGASVEEAAASIRYSSSGEAIVTVGTGRSNKPQIPKPAIREGTETAKLTRKALKDLFDLRKPFIEPQSQSSNVSLKDQRSFRDLGSKQSYDNVREWLRTHQDVQPLVRLQSKRARFAGLANSETCGIWATLDKDVSMTKFTRQDLNKFASSFASDDTSPSDFFPHAILEVRWEGKNRPDLIKALDASHLVERVRGFSLETHAIAILCKPLGMPTPFWLPALEGDIRKLPSRASASRRQSQTDRLSSESGSTRPTSTSATSVADGISSSTFAPLPESPATSVADQLTAPPLKAFKKKRRSHRKHPLHKQLSLSENSQQRYWNEFDDGDEAMENEAYTIFVDPDSSNKFPLISLVSDLLSIVGSKTKASSEKIGSWLRPRSNGETPNEQQALMGNYFNQHPSADDSDADSSLISNHVARHPNPNLYHYSTFPQFFSREVSASPTRAVQNRENILFECFIGSFFASLLCFIAVIVFTSVRNKSNKNITYFGAFVGIILSVVFASAGTGMVFLMRNVSCHLRGLVCLVLAFVVVVNGLTGLGLAIGLSIDPWLG